MSSNYSCIDHCHVIIIVDFRINKIKTHYGFIFKIGLIIILYFVNISLMFENLMFLDLNFLLKFSSK